MAISFNPNDYISDCMAIGMSREEAVLMAKAEAHKRKKTVANRVAMANDYNLGRLGQRYNGKDKL